MGLDVHKIRVGWKSAAGAGGVEAGQRRLDMGKLLVVFSVLPSGQDTLSPLGVTSGCSQVHSQLPGMLQQSPEAPRGVGSTQLMEQRQ